MIKITGYDAEGKPQLISCSDSGFPPAITCQYPIHALARASSLAVSDGQRVQNISGLRV